MIKLIKNYPYDNNYDYIKLHLNKTEQKNYFSSFDKIIIVNDEESQGYIREGESFLIDDNYDNLVNNGVNYIIWNNGHKDMYCFITKKEYVDEITTRIYYEVDVLNTFLFDISLNKSFIERKKCSINEITDFDEGIHIGEHHIEKTMTDYEKLYKWFAMFNGIKQQHLTFQNGVLSGVSEMPNATMKPLTTIDGIQYPLHFMQLQTKYDTPTRSIINTNSSHLGESAQGGFNEGKLSPQGFRFIKGYEGFAPYEYQDVAGYWTICYGVTLHGEKDIYNELKTKQPVTEQEGAQVSYGLKNQNYASKIKDRCVELGITKQCQFDALVSLAYNAGTGVITGDNSLTRAIKSNPNDETTIRNVWEQFYITSGGQVYEGLKLRRKNECNMYFNKPYEVRKIPKLNSKGESNGYVTENNGDGWLPS